MHTWLVLLPSPGPLELGGLWQSLYDLGLPCELEEASSDGSAFVLGPEGEEPRVELSFRPIDRVDLRDRIAEAQSRPPAELVAQVDAALMEVRVARPAGFTLDEDELCRALVALLAVTGQGVVWEPDEKRWWTAQAFAQRYAPRAC